MYKAIIQDADQEILFMLEQMLELNGYETLAVSDYHKLLSSLETFKPCVVLLEFKLSGEDCVATVKKIRKVDPQLPIIVLSSNNAIVAQYKAYDFDGCLPKPFDMDELFNLVDKYCKNETICP